MRRLEMFTAIVVALEEQPGLAVARISGLRPIYEDPRMRLARVPLAGLSVWEEGPIAHPRPGKPVLAKSDSDLLRLVVVASGIKHDEGSPTRQMEGASMQIFSQKYLGLRILREQRCLQCLADTSLDSGAL